MRVKLVLFKVCSPELQEGYVFYYNHPNHGNVITHVLFSIIDYLLKGVTNGEKADKSKKKGKGTGDIKKNLIIIISAVTVRIIA